MLSMLVLLGTIASAWYLLIVRPQKDQQTRHGRLVQRLQVGDHVLTVGGIYGRVVAVEQASVVLELAPGLTSRIATDGIARVVQGNEASLPPVASAHDSTTSTPPTTREHAMQQHPEQPHPQQYAPAQLPNQPFAAPQPPAPATTLRAQVQQHASTIPAAPALPSFEPRPWGSVTPAGSRAAAQPSPVAPVAMPIHAPFATPTLQQPYQQAAPLYAQPAHVGAPAQPTQQLQYAQSVPLPQPTQGYAPAPQPVRGPAVVAQPGHPAQPQYAAPVVQPLQPVAQLTVGRAVAVPVAPDRSAEGGARRGSRAPKGMGSSLRLDDPSLRDTMSRAREERSGLAQEYRKLTAPLVDVDPPQQADAHVAATQQLPLAHHQAGAHHQQVGVDASGAPLFAAVPHAPVAHQYPAPARVPQADAALHAMMPRPVVGTLPGPVDPAYASAFQRPTPYTPQGEPEQGLAHA